MLELTKLQKIFIRQDANFGKIRIFKKEKESADEETNQAGDAPVGEPPAGDLPADGDVKPGEPDVQPGT
jgi:hypothetical protein